MAGILGIGGRDAYEGEVIRKVEARLHNPNISHEARLRCYFMMGVDSVLGKCWRMYMAPWPFVGIKEALTHVIVYYT